MCDQPKQHIPAPQERGEGGGFLWLSSLMSRYTKGQDLWDCERKSFPVSPKSKLINSFSVQPKSSFLTLHCAKEMKCRTQKAMKIISYEFPANKTHCDYCIRQLAYNS